MLTTRRHVDTGPVPTVESKKTYEALWWIPEDPEGKVPGKVILHPENGIHLILNGVFRGHGSRLKSQSFSNEPVILGTQYSGAGFTLLSCQEQKQEVPFGGGFQRQKFVADRLLIRHHFERPDDVRLEWFSVKMTHLKDWMRNVGLSHPERTEEGFFIEYDPERATTVPELRATLPSASIVVKSKPGQLGGHTAEDPMGVEISEWIKVNPDSPISVETALESYVEPLLDFLSLATAAPNSLLRLRAKHPEDSDETPKRSLKIHPTTDYPRFERRSLYNKGQMLFLADDVDGRFQEMMETWFEAHEELREVFDLFFGVHYDQGMRDTNRFLNVMQALETYHRIRVDDGEVYLKDRVSEMVETARPASKKLVSQSEPFAKWAKDSRHFYTHREDRPNRVVARDETLVLLTHSLLWLLRIHFMSEVGFTPSQIEELLEENDRFRVLEEACAEAPWNQHGE
jgi:hypothetical protein